MGNFKLTVRFFENHKPSNNESNNGEGGNSLILYASLIIQFRIGMPVSSRWLQLTRNLRIQIMND
jgi:hypothetical protein